MQEDSNYTDDDFDDDDEADDADDKEGEIIEDYQTEDDDD